MAASSFTAGLGVGKTFKLMPALSKGAAFGVSFQSATYFAGIRAGFVEADSFQIFPPFLASGRSRRAPSSFCQTPEGHLLVCNGLDPVMVWDGVSPIMAVAGMAPPATACTVSGSGTGAIVGTYAAFVRWVDSEENFSNLSPISNIYVVSGRTGSITDVSNTTPNVVTSVGHGLTTGTVVKITGVGGLTSANNTWAITVVDADSFSLDGSFSSTTGFSGGGSWVAGVSGIVYANVPVPQNGNVARRQILRNTDGQATTFYVDVDTTDLFSSSFVSTLNDTSLSAGIAVPLQDSNNNPLANRYTVAPTHKSVMAAHLDRIFLAVDMIYTEGSAAVAFGSTKVTGIGTAWTASMVNRRVYVKGAAKTYGITAVDVAGQVITLDAPYLSPSNPYASYAIRPDPAERRLVYYSESGLPLAWPASNAISVQEDSDDITGLCVSDSFLYILERHHIYRYTFQKDPATDGYTFLANDSRGCINNRCWVQVEGKVYMLDEQGIHSYDGDDSQPLSEPIQAIFRQNEGSHEINWQAKDYFHAVHYPTQEVVRWFIALSGHYLPEHALCYNYRLQRWWIEEFSRPIGSSFAALYRQQRLPFLGSDNAQVLAFWQGNLDGPDHGAGTVQGSVTSATLLSLSDSASAWPANGLVGASVVIIDGTGKDQIRKIVSVSGQTLTIKTPWAILPDTTSVYQLGGIPWHYQGAWWRFVDDEGQNPRRIEIVFEPLEHAATFSLQLVVDTSSSPILWQTGYSSQDHNGVRVQANSPDLVCDLTKASGFIQQRLDARKEFYIDGPRYVFLDLRGVSNADDIFLQQITFDGVAK